MDPQVQEFLDAHAPHFSAAPEGRVKCELNGHTFPARLEPLEAFVSGKKYGKLLAQAQVDSELQRLEPFVVPSRNFPNMLYCALTDELVNRTLREVRQHMKGRKFKNARERFDQDKMELHEEMSLEKLVEVAGTPLEEEAGGGSDAEAGSDGPGVWIPEEVLREYEGVSGNEEGSEGQEAAEAMSVSEGEDDMEEAEGGPPAAAAAASEPKQQPKTKQQPNPQQNGAAKGAKAAGNGAAAKPQAGKKRSGPSRAAKPAAAQQGKQPAAAKAAGGPAKRPKQSKAKRSRV